MPKLNEYKQSYYEFTGLASASARQLAFAGIAIIWIFKNDVQNEISLPEALLYPTAFFVLSLGADLLQYFISSITWGVFHRINEKQLSLHTSADTVEINAPIFFNWPNLTFFYTKIISVIAGYYMLFAHIVNIIQFK